MLQIARAALFAVLPAELLLTVLLVSGVSLPGPVLAGAELAAVAVFVLETVTAYRLFLAARRGGADRRAALRATVHLLVPVQVRRVMMFELRSLTSLALWVTRAPSFLQAPLRCLMKGLGGSRGDGLCRSPLDGLHDTTAPGSREASDRQQGDAPSSAG